MIFGKGKVVLTQGQCVKPKSLIKNSFSFNLITYKRSY
ncbi:MAG: hypothetical protein GY932_10460 [Arcobacter sp.]|nr:hypothetical protein [Arcobacter sp.]